MGDRPASRHDDLMIIYSDDHVIHCAVTVDKLTSANARSLKFEIAAAPDQSHLDRQH